MSHDIIKRLYEMRLDAWAQARDLRVAHQNEPFTPPNNASLEDNVYLSAFLLPAPTTGVFLEGGHKLFRGIFQINIVIPAGVGTAAASSIKEGLAALFPQNLRLTNLEGFTVQQQQPLSEGPGIDGPSTYTIPMSLQYRADIVS